MPIPVRCLDCRVLTRTPTKGRCPTCARLRRRAGYDNGRYRNYRAQLNAKVKRGEVVYCHLCGEALTTDNVTVDHHPPLSAFRRATDWVGELRPACRKCNRKRWGASPPPPTTPVVPLIATSPPSTEGNTNTEGEQ